MKLVTLFTALLVPGIALGDLQPSPVPGSELAAGLEADTGKLVRRRGCNANNCLRAVTGTVSGLLPVTLRQSDCSSFMRRTVSGTSTTTITAANNQRRQQTIIPSDVPTYASACSGTSKYSSACSCWGITATTVTVEPTVTARVKAGILQVKAGDVALGYVATDPNYWTPLITSDSSSALVVNFEYIDGATSVANAEFKTDLTSNHGYPYFGLVSGRDSTSNNVAPGSFNYLYLSPTTHTPVGSTPQVVSSYFTDSTGLSKGSESSVWNINLVTGAVTPTWINTDGALPSVQIFVQSNHIYAGGDPEAFQSRFPAPVTIATLTFIPQ